jgi:DNA end-binding protein Ku
MAARALWKANLSIGTKGVPVRMYSAAQDHTIHFHLLHARDHVRVHERLRRSDDGSIVETRAARTGYVLESGEVVIPERSELARLAPKASRDIEILQCTAPSALPLAAFARPYWLGPDGDDTAYFALAHALGERAELAIVGWVARGKHHFGALTVYQERLMLVELRSADQWLALDRLEAPEARDIDPRELRLAEQLIDGLERPFDHASFRDDHRERVQALIDTKARGGKLPKRRAARQVESSTPLRSALAASVRALNKERKSA